MYSEHFMRCKNQLSAIFLISTLLTACGGGDDSTETGSDPATGGGDTSDPSPSPSPSPSPAPEPAPEPAPPSAGDPPAPTPIILSSSEGAAPGLVGCLNKGLYSFGEVVLNIDYRFTSDYKDPRRDIEVSTGNFSFNYSAQSGSFETADYHRRSVGSSWYTRLRMANNTIYERGTTIYGPNITNPEAEAIYFDLEVGETRRNSFRMYDGQMNQDGSPRLRTGSWDRTYLGRETVTVPAGTFETCRVNYTTAAEFKDSWWHLWYAVGSGVLVKGINFQPAGRRADAPTMTFTRELQAASFGSVQVRP